MAKDDPHFRLRIPEDLKAQIEGEAKVAERSINAEIVARLRSSFEKRRALEDEYVRRYVTVLESENEALKKAQALLETMLFDFAHALRKASDGNTARLENLVEQEKERRFLDRIIQASTDEIEDRS